MKDTVNILLLGKTGVGKSSFINYFVGDDVAATGAGEAVTQGNFDMQEVDADRCVVHIYDTRGLEALDAGSQTDEIIAAVKERGSSEDMTQWFHTIFYCVSMANPRFEDFEADFIRRLRQDTAQRVHIVLTNCDGHTPEQLQAMHDTIAGKVGGVAGPGGTQFFDVVSVETRKRSGQVVERSGRDEVAGQVFELFREDIAYRMSTLYARTLRTALLDAVDDSFQRVDEFIEANIKASTFMEFLKDSGAAKSHYVGLVRDAYDDIMRTIDETRKSTDEQFATLLKPISDLYASYRGAITGSYVEAAALRFDDTAQWMDVEGLLRSLDRRDLICKVLPRVGNKVADALESGGSVRSLFKSAGAGAADLLALKKNLKKTVAEVKEKVVDIVPSESEIQGRVERKILESLPIS